MLARLSSPFWLLVVLVVVCAGCADTQIADDPEVESRGAQVSDVELEEIASERVPMTREAFVYYVANETVGDPDDDFILFLKIPGTLTPEKRSENYTAPLDEALKQAELGKVVSAAAMMGAKPFAGVSVEVSDLEQGVDVIIEVLRESDAPEGTEIRYGEGEKKFMVL